MSHHSTHFLSGLNYRSLGSLGDISQSVIRENAAMLETILHRAENAQSKKQGDLLHFDEIDRLYNIGISDDEKKAWVWYKRSLGYPMKGWDKYFLAGAKNQTHVFDEIITTTDDAVIKDNRWEEITTVPKGIVLGKPTKYQRDYQDITWLVFVAEDGAKRLVDISKVKVSKPVFQVNQSDVDELVQKHCLFYVQGLYLPYPVYAYGNMYDRLLMLQQDEKYIIETYGQTVYNVQLSIVNQVKPRLLSVQNIDPRERPKIVAISDFARGRMKSDNFSIKQLREESGLDLQKNIRERLDKNRFKKSREEEAYRNYWKSREDEDGYSVTLQTAFRMWLYTLDRNDIDEVSVSEIITYYLNAGRYGDNLTESQIETFQKFCPLEGEKLFSRFLNEALTFEDQQKLDYLWNRLYNAYSPIPYHKVPVGFACSAFFKQSLLEIAPAQREAIAFMEIAGSGIIAYDVGVGKTMSAIVTLANALYSGKSKRALVVVPNPTYQKWKREIGGYQDPKTGEVVHGVLSHTGIKLYDWYNIGANLVKVNSSGEVDINGHHANRSVDANSITIVTYEGLAKMGYSEKLMGTLFTGLVNILEQTEDHTKSQRDLEKRNQKYRAMLGKSQKGSLVDIDTLGFDYIVIDEAHNFKNIFDTVPADEEGNKRYKIESATSDRAVKAFFLCNYIQRVHGANVCLLTATPFTNSPLEIFSMMSLVGYDSMKKMGIYNLQQFMQLFVQQSYEFVNSYDGTIKQAPVVKSYNNRLILQRLLYNHITYKTGEEVGVKRPIKINLPKVNEIRDGKVIRLASQDQVLTYLRPTAIQQMHQQEIEALAKSGGVKALAKIGIALGLNLDNAISPYLVEGTPDDAADFVNSSPKIKYVIECIATVKKWHEERGEPCSGQVIYMNRGKDFFSYMKQYLHEFVGFKQNIRHNGRTFDEVEVISSGISNERKEAIKDAFLDGAVKVIIGTATIREGIDLQKNGTCLYLITLDWNPTDIKQIEGRIYRQGNEYGYVRVVAALVQDSMDVFVFQKLEEKTARINDIWYRSDRGNVLDQESLDPEEIKFALFSDIDELVRIKLEQNRKELKRRFENLDAGIGILAEFKGTLDTFRLLQGMVINKVIVESKSTFVKFLADFEYNTHRYQSLIQMSLEARKAFKESLEKHVDDLNLLLQSTNYEDREVLKRADKSAGLFRKLFGDSGVSYTWNNLLSSYREILSKVRKTEKTVLQPKGFSLHDDISELVQQYQNERNSVEKQANYLFSPEGMRELREEVQTAKDRLAVSGKSPEERAVEFAKLNYLLAFKAGQTTENTTPYRGNLLPSAASEPKSSSSQKLAIAKAKMKMKLAIALALESTSK